MTSDSVSGRNWLVVMVVLFLSILVQMTDTPDKSCEKCKELEREICNLKSQISIVSAEEQHSDQPPAYSYDILREELHDPANATITLFHGLKEQFGEKFSIQFKVYNGDFERGSVRTSAQSTFTGKGFDPERGLYSITGSLDASSSEITLQLNYQKANFVEEFKGTVDWKTSSIAGTFSIPPWSIAGGDPFQFQFFSITK